MTLMLPTSPLLPADNPPGVPLIGYQNLVTTTNISSISALAGFPITNVANPATHNYWESTINGITQSEVIEIDLPGTNLVDYIGIASHNFFFTQSVFFLIDNGVSPFIPLLNPSASIGPVLDDSPLIIRFAPGHYTKLQLVITSPALDHTPRAAVIYVGKLLVLERGIKVDVQHVPITYGRKTRIVNGMSETGNFLGRIVLGESRESRAEFFGFTPDFYRQQMEPFVAAAVEAPFFWAWAPTDYPLETGYSWLTGDAQPQVSPDHLRVALTLDMAGVIN